MKCVRHYLIRWKGYGPESDTWEETLNCPEIITQFTNSKKLQNSGKKRSSEVVNKSKKSKSNVRENEFEISICDGQPFEILV